MAFSPEIVSKLEAPVNPADVEIKLDGESVNQYAGGVTPMAIVLQSATTIKVEGHMNKIM